MRTILLPQFRYRWFPWNARTRSPRLSCDHTEFRANPAANHRTGVGSNPASQSRPAHALGGAVGFFEAYEAISYQS
jgi:hypothetical protein